MGFITIHRNMFCRQASAHTLRLYLTVLLALLLALVLPGANVRAATCTPTITPYINVNGAWLQTATASVTTTTQTVNLGPQPNRGGTWAWSGPNGFTATARQINRIALSAGVNTYTATYTNVSGCQSTQAFTITAPAPTAITPFLQVNGAAWQQASSATVAFGSTVNLGPQPGGGTWAWTGPNGYTSSSQQINSIPLPVGVDSYVATYTNTSGIKSTQTYTITVTPASTSTSLTASSTNTSTGSAVTLSSSAAPAAATGTVTFYDGATALGSSSLSAGVATLSTSFSTAGTHTITAVYGGSSNYAGSTSSAVSITVASSCSATNPIAPYIFTNGSWGFGSSASVSSASTVVNLGPQPSNGTWSWTGPNGFTSSLREIDNIALGAGVNTYTVTYSLNGCSYQQAFTITVPTGLPQPTVSVTPEATIHPYAENLLVTTTVAGGSFTPTGSVTLTRGSFTSTALSLNNGNATFYIQPGWLAQGSAAFTVTYTPDANSASTYSSSTGTSDLTITSPGSTNVTLNINTNANRHLISPYIYGINSLTPSDITNLSPGLVRFGGNQTTNYNWKLFTYNSGGDWYYQDFGLGGVDSVALTQHTTNTGSHMLTTMPMLDWVAGESVNGTNRNWSFSVAKYGPQCGVDPYNPDAGNGLKAGNTGDCRTSTQPVTNSPSTNAYYPLVDTPSDCTTGNCLYRSEWAAAQAIAFGNRTCNVPYTSITSCHFYDMDNEPEIWNGSHRDVHPTQPGYSELANLFEAKGRALKTWDPSAVRFGPITCCWNFLWTTGGSGDDKYAHGGVDFAPWWLNHVNWLDQINGSRTLDVFDIHAYFGNNIDNTGFSNKQLRQQVNKYVRTFWDPTYFNAGIDAGWITTTQPNRAVTFLIPRMKALANAIYPGTPVAFTEWESFFGEWEFATALSDADAFGVMGREGLSFSTRWGGPSATDGSSKQPHPNYQSFKLWTNYDGAGHGFGTLSVQAKSSANPDQFVSFAALDEAGTTMTIMVLNRDSSNAANVSLNLNGFNATSYKTYQVASTNPGAIVASGSASWSANQTFAPYSITLLVVSGTQPGAPAAEWHMVPDDLMVSAGASAQMKPSNWNGAPNQTVSSAVFDAYDGAPACAGSFNIDSNTIQQYWPAFLTVNAPTTPGFCHYTVTASDGVTNTTQGGWIVVGNPAATLTASAGNGQTAARGSTLAVPLTVTLNPGASGTYAQNAEVFFSTSAGTLSNGTSSGSKVIATTNASGVASVTLTLPATAGTVTVTAQDQIAVGGATVTFTATGN